MSSLLVLNAPKPEDPTFAEPNIEPKVPELDVDAGDPKPDGLEPNELAFFKVNELVVGFEPNADEFCDDPFGSFFRVF